jgi:hypothetical protein
MHLAATHEMSSSPPRRRRRGFWPDARTSAHRSSVSPRAALVSTGIGCRGFRQRCMSSGRCRRPRGTPRGRSRSQAGVTSACRSSAPQTTGVRNYNPATPARLRHTRSQSCRTADQNPTRRRTARTLRSMLSAVGAHVQGAHTCGRREHTPCGGRCDLTGGCAAVRSSAASAAVARRRRCVGDCAVHRRTVQG